MRIFRDWRDLPADARGASVALGNFDGVHLGHAHLLRAARGARPDAPLAVLTFEPHPREYFRSDDPPFRLTLSANLSTSTGSAAVPTLTCLSASFISSTSTPYWAIALVRFVLPRAIAAHILSEAGWSAIAVSTSSFSFSL